MSWPAWPGTAMPGVTSSVINPLINSAPPVLPTGSQYTPEQWAQMQQQNWQQWAQWQQQYQQWHQQYGAEFQKSMSALTGSQVPVPTVPMAGAPPLPVEAKPPPPPNEPPDAVTAPNYQTTPNYPPPAASSESSINAVQPNPVNPNIQTAPPSYNQGYQTQNWQNQNAPYNNRNNMQANKRPFGAGNDYNTAKKPMMDNSWNANRTPGPNQWTHPPPSAAPTRSVPSETKNQYSQPPPPIPKAASVEELSEAEKKFDKQFADWEAQFNKWKDQNVSHPDKEQYREYEKKWETWRAQLLERREQMRRKRLGLSDTSTPPKSTVPPTEILPAQTNFTQAPPGYKPVPDKRSPLLATPATILTQIGGQEKSADLKTPYSFNKPPPHLNNEPLSFSGNSALSEEQIEGNEFLKTSSTGGIPGLDLVKDDEPENSKEKTDEPEVIELDPEEKGPDLEALSKGINSILGDHKLLSMLSKVSQNQHITTTNLTDTTTKITETLGNDNVPPVSLLPTDQSNMSCEGSNQGDYQPLNNQRDLVNNFDDQTRSSFTAGYNDGERFAQSESRTNTQFNDNFGGPSTFGNNFNRNDFGPNQFGAPPNRNHFLSAVPGILRNDFGSTGLNRSDFGSGGPNRNDFGFSGPNKKDFGPGGTNREDIRPGGPNNSSFGIGMQKRGDFTPGGDFGGSNRGNIGHGGQNMSNFGPVGLNRGDFGQNRGGFGSGGPNKGGRFGSDGQNRRDFGPGGPNASDFGSGGLNRGDFGPGGPNASDFGSGGLNRGDFGPVGPNRGGSGLNTGDFGHGGLNRGDFAHGGPNRGDFGHGGPNRGDFKPGGQNRNEFGPNNNNFDPLKSDTASNNFTQGGPGRNNYNNDNNVPGRFGGNNQSNFHKDSWNDNRNDNQFGGNNYNQEQEDYADDENYDDYDDAKRYEEWAEDDFQDNDNFNRTEPSFHPGKHFSVHNVPPPLMATKIEAPQAYKESESSVEPVRESTPPPEEKLEVLNITNVIDYDHKPLKKEEVDVCIEPIHMFDYRHKQLNRIPYPQRPKWLFDVVKGVMQFEPLVARFDMAPRRHEPQHWRADDYRRPDNYRRIHSGSDRRDKPFFEPPSYRDDARRGSHIDDRNLFSRGRNRKEDSPINKEKDHDGWTDYRRDDKSDDRVRFDRFREDSNRDQNRDGKRTSLDKNQEDRDRENRRSWGDDNKRSSDRNWIDQDDRDHRNWDDRDRYERGQREFGGRSRSRDRSRESFDRNSSGRNKDSDAPEQFKNIIVDQNATKNSSINNITLIQDLLCPPGRFSRPARIVIILRGPPGSGKSFLAKLIKDKEIENGGSAPRILCLDDYFMVEQEKEVVEDGKKVKLKEMVYEYEECMEESYRTSLMKSFKKTITDGYFPFIIVDNINDKVKYFGEMWSFAKQNGFQVYICQLDLDIQLCSKRNIHNRSEADIKKCVDSWETTPPHHPILDATMLLQSGSIEEVEMEEINSPVSDTSVDKLAERDLMASVNPSAPPELWKSTSNWTTNVSNQNPPNPARRGFDGQIWRNANNRRR